MNQTPTHLTQTWEAPKKELVFQGYKEIGPPTKPMLIVSGITFVVILIAIFFIIRYELEGISAIALLSIPSIIDMPIILQIVKKNKEEKERYRFFKKQTLFRDETFISSAQKTSKPRYYEVLRVERVDPSQVPPSLQELPDINKLVLVETQAGPDSPSSQEGTCKWAFSVEPHESVPIQPGDHLVSLYGGQKDRDRYAVHAQSCTISGESSLPKITIPPESVLLSYKNYIVALNEQDT